MGCVALAILTPRWCNVFEVALQFRRNYNRMNAAGAG